MTELERLRQELIKLRDHLLNRAETANKLSWDLAEKERWEDMSFQDGRCDAFEDAAALLTQLIGEN